MMKSEVTMSANVSRARSVLAACLLLLVGALSGCAHTNTRDPLEPLNRGIFAFNDAVDNVVVKPVAMGYRAVLPQFVRTGVSNFFSNLDDITVIVNGFLQLKIPQAVSDSGRFLINTTVGVLGLFDVATHLGLEKHNEDFGQTLGYWGIGSGPYLVLPFLGPSSLRDGLGRWADYAFLDPVIQIDHMRTRNQVLALRATQYREQLLDSEKVLEAAAIDRYAFLRDAYLQRRRNLVYDGNPPPNPEEDEAYDKPLSEGSATTISILVDQFGNAVTSTYAAPAPKPAPTAGSSAPAAMAPAPTPLAPTPVVVAPSPAADQAVPQDMPPSGATPSSNGAASADRVIRVWLSGSSSQ